MSEENANVVEEKDVENAVVEEISIESTPVKSVPPIMFLEENASVDIDVDVISEHENGKILYVLPKGAVNQDDKKLFLFTPFSFKFSIPNWEQISLYRQRSTANSQGRFDKNIFRTFLLLNHLKAWNIKDSNGDIVELEFDISGELTKESSSKINRVPSIVWDSVLTMVERAFGIEVG
jgi:hypothetical protein